MFKRVIELKFFSRAISSDEKVEEEIEIQREGAGQKFEGNPNSNCFVGVCKSKTEFELKIFLVAIIEATFLNDFAVKSLTSRRLVGTLWELHFGRCCMKFISCFSVSSMSCENKQVEIKHFYLELANCVLVCKLSTLSCMRTTF